MKSALGVLFCISLAVGGCASPTGTTSLPDNQTLALGMSRVVVERNTDFLYLALSARVKVNGKQIGELSRGDKIFSDIEPGRTNISVDNWSFPGSYSISFTAKPNFIYQFEVSPRGESYGPVALAGFLGAAADAAANERSGGFKIVGVSSEKARPEENTLDAQPATTVLPKQGGQPGGDTAGASVERLRTLKHLFEEGLISKNDYEAKKAEILKAF